MSAAGERSAARSAELTLECRSCGAALTVAPDHRTVTCAYCDSPAVVERPPAADRPAPSFALGFVLDQERAAAAARAWIRSRGLFAHSGLKRATIDKTRPVYLPAYLYGASAQSGYSASIGENYTVVETYTTTDSKGRTVTRTRTRTVTEWRALRGQHAAYVQDVVVTASRGVTNEELEAVEPFDLGALRRYDPALIAGWPAEEASRGRDECYELARSEAQAQIGRALSAFMPGDSHRELRFQTTLEHEVIDLALLPLWVFALRYAEGAPPLRVLVNGQTGRVGGRVPLSTWKIALAVLLGLLLVGGVVALVLAASGAGGRW